MNTTKATTTITAKGVSEVESRETPLAPLPGWIVRASKEWALDTYQLRAV